MPQAKASSTLAALVDTDSEDDLNIPHSTADQEKRRKPTNSKQKGKVTRKTAAKRVTKPVNKPARRSSGRIAASIEKLGGRQVLAEQDNNTTKKPSLLGVEVTMNKPRAANVARGVEHTPESEETKFESHRRLLNKDENSRDPDTEAAAQQIQLSTTEADYLVTDYSLSPNPPSNTQHSDVTTTCLTDTMLRRRLGDLSRKFEALEAKYQTLKAVGVVDAEKNFEKLKKQSTDKEQMANQLISTLKAELASQTRLVSEGQHLRTQLEGSQRLVQDLEQRVKHTSNSLAEARLEIQGLANKLAVSRSIDSTNLKAPGSAMRNAGSTSHEFLQAMQMKEDLYADLTGLIVRAVKHAGGEDIYDCIQTGRNGTLHFKLSIGEDSTSDTYEDAHFTYRPQLDANRDRDLIEVLPDYLTEEITFPRPHAAKFYARVTKALTETIDGS